MDMSFNPNKPPLPLRPSSPEERHKQREREVHRHMQRALDLRDNASRSVLLEKLSEVRDRLAFFLRNSPEHEFSEPDRYATLAEYRKQLRWLEENIRKI